MIKIEISNHITQHLVFDLDKINDMIKSEIKDHIKTLNAHLQGKTHLVANRITVADIAIAMNLIPLY
jgi:glutathione S-transferase